MGFIVRTLLDSRHLTVVVKEYLRLRYLKVQRSGGETQLSQLLRKLMYGKDGGNLPLRDSGAVASVYESHHLFVGEAHLRTDYRLCESAGDAASVAVEGKKRGERKPVLPRHQRTHAVGESLRQHRHDAVQKVHARGTAARLAVERGAGRNVMRHVGYVHTKDAVAFAVLLYRQGIIKILCRNRVARKDELLPEIEPVLLPFDTRGFNALRLIQHHFRKTLRKVVLFHDGLDVIFGRIPLNKRKFLPFLAPYICLYLFHRRNYTI